MAVLLVHWPDFAGDAGCHPAVFAQLARRRLCALHGTLAGYVWDPQGRGGPAATSEFRRWGLDLVTAPWSPDLAARLVGRHPGVSPVVFAMDAERAREAVLACDTDPDAEVWSPRVQPGALPAAEVLGWGVGRRVALMADGAALPAEGRSGTLRRLAALAEAAGALTVARAYAEGEVRELLAGPDPVEGPGDLRGAVEALLDGPDPPDTLVLIAGGDAAEPLLRRARGRGVRAVLWHVGPPPAPQVALLASATADLSGLLPGREAPAPPPSLPRIPRPPAAAGPDAEVLPDGYVLTVWSRLAFQLIRAGDGLPAAEAVERLTAHGEFGPTVAEARAWLERAEAHGLLDASGEDGARVRLASGHPICRAAREVPERCIRLLAQMLQRIPWVSFKLLRTVLLREQWLGGPPYRLDETAVDEWLNYLVSEGVLEVSKEANLVNPEHPVTALRLAEGDGVVHAVLQRLDGAAGLQAERVILAVDHFLIRQRKPWMAISVLRRRLADLGREELQAVLQRLQLEGALLIESYPNPQREHATTGCRLAEAHPRVAAARAARDRLLVGLAGTEAPAALQEADPAWLSILRDEELLDYGNGATRLRMGDPVVRAALGSGPRGVGTSERADYTQASWPGTHSG